MNMKTFLWEPIHINVLYIAQLLVKNYKDTNVVLFNIQKMKEDKRGKNLSV